MNAKPPLPRWSSGRRVLLGFVALAALRTASVPAHADPFDATAASSRVADVSLADLNLATPEGMSVARERLHGAGTQSRADISAELRRLRP